MEPHKKIQFVSDRLVEQIIRREKTASVVSLEGIDVAEDEYDDPLFVGQIYDVYDSELKIRASIRITGIELCRWDCIPERLWRGETNQNAEEFKKDHQDYFEHPDDSFEFAAYYFELV